ncbi:MAG: hypothetical protein AB1656_21315 [Candidatus Omnitrophota bacterium]
MNAELSPLVAADYAVIAGFFASMLGIGFYFSNRMRSLQDYFSGSRRIPWWISGASFYMSSFSAFTFVAYSALAYQYGWVSVTIYWVTVPAAIVSAVFFASRWRRAAESSPLEYIEDRYSSSMRQSLAWLGAPVKVIDGGLKLFALGSLVSAGLDFPLRPAIWLSGLIVLTYTLMGGLWAVMVTDFVQFVILLAVVLLLVPLSLSKAGGISGFWQSVPDGFFSMTTEKYNWTYLLAFLVIIGLNFSTSWSLVQRYYCVRDEKAARKVGYMVAFLNIISPPLLFIPAMAASVFLPGLNQPNDVYPLLCRALLPLGLMGMLIAAMFSATMSMLSGDYNAVAAVLTNDVYKRFVSPRASLRRQLAAARIITLVIGLLSLWIALYVVNARQEGDLFQKMVKLFSVFLPPIALPMLLGLINRKVSNAGSLWGLWLGISAGLIAYWLGGREGLEFLRREQVITSLTVGFTIVGLIAGSLIFPVSARQRGRIEQFFAHIESPAPQDAIIQESAGSAISPFGIIGWSIASLGGVLIAVLLVTAPWRQALLSFAVGGIMTTIGGIFLAVARHKGKENLHE